MGYEHLFEYFLLGAVGAAAFELLKLYEQYGKVPEEKYAAQLRSPLFWCVVGGFLISSGFIAWAVNSSVTMPSKLQIISTGIAARTVVREIASAKIANSTQILGDDFNIRDMFA